MVEFISAQASLNLTDVSEIPDEAELAETFYSQFEDEFENDDSEDDSKDDDDLSALMGQMQIALEQTESHDEILPEDQQLTDTLRRNRIQALRTYPWSSLHLHLLFICFFVCRGVEISKFCPQLHLFNYDFLIVNPSLVKCLNVVSQQILREKYCGIVSNKCPNRIQHDVFPLYVTIVVTTGLDEVSLLQIL